MSSENNENGIVNETVLGKLLLFPVSSSNLNNKINRKSSKSMDYNKLFINDDFIL